MGPRTLAVLLLLLLAGLLLPARARAAAQSAAGTAGREADTPDLQQRLKDVTVVERDGRLWVDADPGPGEQLVEGGAWLRALHAVQEDQRSHGFFYVLFNITKPWSFAWIAVGFLGQALFTFRMVLQWWASEKEKRSVIPVGFWWGSLLGGILLFAYFVWRKDVVGIIGQSTGVFVYARNLILIYRGTTPVAAS